MNRALQIILPIVVVGAGGGGAYLMWVMRPKVAMEPAAAEPPLIRTATTTAADLQLEVHTQGTVRPRTETVLIAEVRGLVTEVSPSLAEGGFFAKGEVLVELEARDYELSILRAKAALASAQHRLSVEQAEADTAKREWSELMKGKEAPPLVLREPQLLEARAAVAAAEADLEVAERNLARTEIKAPYEGRVRTKNVDVGQWINAGVAVATVYAVDYAEVRLPLPDAELEFVDLPLDYLEHRPSNGQGTAPPPTVKLTAEFAGSTWEWQGTIVRTEGELDATSRQVHAIARVEDPYGRSDTESKRPPLLVGMFVHATILGKKLENVVTLPAAALRGRDQVLVVDDDSRLRFRQIQVLRSTDERVVVEHGVEPGERVCVTPLDYVIEGMSVRTSEDPSGGAR